MVNQAVHQFRTIDAGLHNAVPSVDVLMPYLSSYWQEELRYTAFKGPSAQVYPASLPTSTRPGLPPGVPGGDAGVLVSQAIDEVGVDIGILHCTYAVDTIHNPDAAVALARAVNDWQVAEWLERDPRLRASIVLPSNDPDSSVEEITRVGDQPGFVQVSLPARSRELYGQRRYLPLLRAAAERGLVVALSYGGFSGNPPTAVGWPTYAIEEDVGMAQIVQSQVMSLVSEGVFEQVPDLQVVIINGGFTWLPSFMWRLDKDWKGIRREVPWVRKPPSEYIRRHLHFTLTPVDAPADQPEVLRDIIRQMWGDELLLYASDYPHWRFEAQERAFYQALDPAGLPKVMGDNAADLYRLN
jgi:predicted TIM-barrel fold metal-dependent hydrolase